MNSLSWILLLIAVMSLFIWLLYFFLPNTSTQQSSLPEFGSANEIKKIKPPASTPIEEKTIYRKLHNKKIRLILAPEAETLKLEAFKNHQQKPLQDRSDPFAVLSPTYHNELTKAPLRDHFTEGLMITYLKSPALIPIKRRNDYYVQLGTNKTKSAADDTWHHLIRLYPHILQQCTPEVIRYRSSNSSANFYLLRVYMDSFEQAKNLCYKLGNAGHRYCLIDLTDLHSNSKVLPVINR